MTIEQAGADLHFQFFTWIGMLDDYESGVSGWRPRRLSFQFANGALTRHFGYVCFLGLLVEDWLTEPWKLAQEGFSHEIFPAGNEAKRRVVVYCAIEPNAPCPDWPNPVDFELEWSKETWKVGAVRSR